jgi:hypothetical protein
MLAGCGDRGVGDFWIASEGRDEAGGVPWTRP